MLYLSLPVPCSAGKYVGYFIVNINELENGKNFLSDRIFTLGILNFRYGKGARYGIG